MFRNNKNWMAASLATALLGIPAIAQQYPPPPPPQQQQYPPQQGQYPPQQQDPNYNQPIPPSNFPPDQLDNMVSRIALYPDPLLAQIFAAATFPDQIQAAAQWSDAHHYLQGQDLANAIQNDQLGFDPAVQALLPFPSVLQMMASDLNWTANLGAAFATQGDMLQDSVQRMRKQAYDYGYLKSNDQIVVNNSGPYIDIEPYNPGYITVPYYDPAVVFYRPWRPGFVGLSFGYGVSVGGFFRPWGWGYSRFAWDRHQVFINNRVWDRRIVSGYRPGVGYVGPRGAYRPGVVNRRPVVGVAPHPEPHALQPRSGGERQAAQRGRPAPRESHRGGGDRGHHE